MKANTIRSGLAAALAAGLVAGCSQGSVSAPPQSFSVGGTVSGLTGSGLVLQINGGGNMSIAADGPYTFTTPISSGSTYNVTVLGFPSAPTEACTVTNGSGTASGTVTNVNVACTAGYLVGGMVSGLTGTGLVLRDNGVADQAITIDGGFTFNAPVAVGGAYSVVVHAPPTGQSCTVTGGSGTSSTDVSSVAVSCTLGFSLATEVDPLVGQQWHLKNTGQTGFSDTAGAAGFDVNVDPVFMAGISGVGVIAAVVDTGLEIAHEDLAVNVVPGGSYNFNNGSSDPTSAANDGDHGTSVAGLIAMARNSTGGIGVAPAAKLKGFNFLSSNLPLVSQLVAALGASSANPASSDVAIFNESFGQTVSDGHQHINPTVLAQLISGVNTLRGGKGALYVKAGGNGFFDMGTGTANCTIPKAASISCENANFDPENATPYQIVVGAIVASGIKASYSTAGSALWVSAPGGGGGFNVSVAPGFVAEAYQPAMVTTDQSGCSKGFSVTPSVINPGESRFNNGQAPNTSCNYTNTMNGTSSATPVTVGAIALMLEANPALTWRDVKHILASTARQIDPLRAATSIALSNGTYVAEPAWTINNAGFHFHNWYGFGMVDAGAAVTMAKTYTADAFGALGDTGALSSGTLNQAIPDNSITGTSSSINVSTGMTFTEAVQISVTATHLFTGDLAIELTAPSGAVKTRSVLKTGDDGFFNTKDLSGMVLVSNAFYGENPAGSWTLKVVDVRSTNVGTLGSWTLRIYGH